MKIKLDISNKKPSVMFHIIVVIIQGILIILDSFGIVNIPPKLVYLPLKIYLILIVLSVLLCFSEIKEAIKKERFYLDTGMKVVNEFVGNEEEPKKKTDKPKKKRKIPVVNLTSEPEETSFDPFSNIV